MTFETFYQSDEETWPDQKNTMAKRNTKTMTKTNTFRENLQRATPETCELWDIWSEWWGDMAWQKKTKTKTMTQTMTKTIPETYDIWDTDYNSDNWEPEFMTIFVVWQLRVTLDSIRNSCDVYLFFIIPSSPYISAFKPKMVTESNIAIQFHYITLDNCGL